MRSSIAIACLAGAVFAAGCVGADGLQGAKGEAGPAGSAGVGPEGPAGAAGTQGADGKAGANGKDGADGKSVSQVGAVKGTVVDDQGNAIAGVALVTDPPTADLTSDAAGAFSLKDANIGAYTLTATKKGYGDATLVFGVVSSGTTTVKVTMKAVAAVAAASISGLVQGPTGQPLGGAKVTVDGQGLEATTAADGTFTVNDVMPGFVFFSVKSPDASKYLDGETRSAVDVGAAANVKDVKIGLSGRPSDSATYVGTFLCAACHKSYGDQHKGSAHARSITSNQSRMVAKSLWPAVGTTVNPNVKALSPVDGQSLVSVVLCQKVAGVYSVKFGGAADCSVADGTLVPIAATYGGEGDGGIDQKPNLGVHKQQFLAKLADVPVAGGWTYVAGKDKDFLVLPVQVTQSGSGGPKLEAYHAVASAKGDDGWTDRAQTFSHACAGCHVGGLVLDWEKQSGKSYITSFGYAEQDLDAAKQLNIACEGCHGPGSDHFDAANGDKPATIIRPKLMTAKAERELCGKCHAAHDGTSASPPGLGYPWNSGNAAKLGAGEFYAGVYSLGDYVGNLDSGGVVNWPDGKHAKEHRQQFSMFESSVHANNSYERLACSNCHNAHSQAGAPPKTPVTDGADLYELSSPQLGDNTACLRCHAAFGPYAAVSKVDVANMVVAGGGTVAKNGKAYAPSAGEQAASRSAFAASTTAHMSAKSAMSLAGYDPENAAFPVGRCSSCHMPKTAKSGGFTIENNDDGVPAMASGDGASHVFDVIQPWQGQATAKGAATPADVMPSSCSSCHIEDRFAPN